MVQVRPARNACRAAPPKITGGASSGSTITAISTPPRRLARARAAPMPPTKAKARPPSSGARRRSAARRAAARPGRWPPSGAASASGAPVASHWARHLTAATSFQRQRAQRQQIERAVLEVALEQPLQRQQAGQRQPDPGRAAAPRPPAAAGPARRPAAAGWPRRRRSPAPAAAAAAAPGQRQLAPQAAAIQATHAPTSTARGRRSAGDRAPPPGSGRRRPGARPSSRRTGCATRRRAAPGARPAATAAAARRAAAPGPGAGAGRPRAAAPPGRAAGSVPAARRPRAPRRRRRRSSRAWNTSSSRAVRAVFSPSWWPSRWQCNRRASSASRSPAAPRKPHIAPSAAGSARPRRAAGWSCPRRWRPTSATASPAARRQVDSPRTARRSPRCTARFCDVKRDDHRALARRRRLQPGERAAAHGRATLRGVYETRGRTGTDAARAGRCVSGPIMRAILRTDFRAASNRERISPSWRPSTA